jgi:transcriptional regulator of heat shock response
VASAPCIIMQLTQRNIDILKIIVDEYLSTGTVL